MTKHQPAAATDAPESAEPDPGADSGGSGIDQWYGDSHRARESDAVERDSVLGRLRNSQAARRNGTH